MKRKRIIITTNTLSHGGAQRVAVRLANTLAQRHDVFLIPFVSEITYPVSDQVHVVPLAPAMKIREARWPFRRFSYHLSRLRGILFFIRFKLKVRPDATLSFLEKADRMNLLSPGPGARILSERNNPRRKEKGYFENACKRFSRADRVVFQSETVRHMYPEAIRKKGIVIPNPVEVSCMATSPAGHKIVSVGRLHPQKNFPVLFRAFKRFVADHPGYTLHIYGDGDEKPVLETLIQNLSLQYSVFLEGFSNDVHRDIRDAEFFVMSSDFEGMPNALLEALMMGLPCISTAFEGTEEFIGRKACLLTPVGDEQALAGAMAALADNERYRQELAAAGAAYAQRFRTELVISQWENLLCPPDSYSPSFVRRFGCLVRIRNRFSNSKKNLGLFRMRFDPRNRQDFRTIGKFEAIIPGFEKYNPHIKLLHLRIRALENRSVNLEQYYRDVTAHPDKLAYLKENLTYVGSHFFRGQSWPELSRLCRAVFADPDKDLIRVWCAGCSSGKEVYSILMILYDIFPGRRIDLLATDYNHEMLRLCQEGVYSVRTMDEIPPGYWHYTEKYVSGRESSAEFYQRYQFRFVSQLREQIRTQPLNLLTDDYPGGFDLILCRNVIKFFDPGVRAEVQGRLAESLNQDGFLMVSDELDTEGIREPKSFGLSQIGNSCIYQKAQTGRVVMGKRGISLNLPGWETGVLGRQAGGKLCDSEDSFLFFYRAVDPHVENFRLSATFVVEDASRVGFQTGYGIMAVDTVESPEENCQHRNHALLGRFRTVSGSNYGFGLRIIGGYTDPLARPQDGRRLLDPSRLFLFQNPEDRIRTGDRHRFILEKTDSGLKASMEMPDSIETISFPGCDFLLKQDKKSIYIGFALAGDIALSITDIRYETFPGKLSRTPKDAIGNYIPDYPFQRTLLPEPPCPGGARLRDATIKVTPGSGPGSLADALRQAGPGCEIVLSNGVYDDGPYYIPATTGGSPGRPVVLRAEHPGKAVIDGSGIERKLPALTLRGCFWILDGLVFRNAPSSGLFVCGSDNVIRNCEAAGNGDTGILLCTFPGSSRKDWPSRNRVEHCVSHDNCDPVRHNADGFGAKLSIGPGNRFYRCLAHNNIDDGCDLYSKSTLGPIHSVVLERCEAAFNGFLSSEQKPLETTNGVGFKLGGERQRVRHLLKDCSSHDNAGSGFSANSNPACRLVRCTAWNNYPDYLHCHSLHVGKFFSRPK